MEKEQLLQTIWNDKKGKEDGSPFGLYVGLSSPHPNFSSITRSMLEQLATSPHAYGWAKSWGRLVISVRPGYSDECLLANTTESTNKSFITVDTRKIISPVSLVAPLPQGDLGTIYLNSQRATPEAILISYLHMVDEFVWDLSRKNSQDEYAFDRYYQAVEQVMEKGFSTNLASEDEIMAMRLANPSISVRLYGSGVNRFVPKVMGAIDFTKGQPLQCRFIDCLEEGGLAKQAA